MKNGTIIMAMGVLMASASGGRAEVKLPSLWSDNMVLQRGKQVPVWGTATVGERVSVKFAGQEKNTIAGADGKWMVRLSPLKEATGLTLSVAGANTLVFKNVAVGDVYLCSGQSNMEYPLSSWAIPESQVGGKAATDVAAANHPNIRLFTVPKAIKAAPLSDTVLPSSWQVCTPDTARGFSAVGYFFGRELHQKLGVPIGLINASWSGTGAAAWTSRDALERMPEFKTVLSSVDEAGGDNPHNQATVLYNGMIAPLLPFALRGVVWYQGEGNVDKPVEYRTLFPSLIRDWRRHFGQGDFGFYFVQLANYLPRAEQPNEGGGWAELREAQTMTLALPHTGMATIIDIGQAEDAHPTNKLDVGKRLALAALADQYGQKIEFSGPMFQSLKVEGSTIRVTFSHAAGLKTKDGTAPQGFIIAGPDNKFAWAQARIEGNSVVLSSDAVKNPTTVRYAWANNPPTNLVNAADLPAVPFRSDAPNVSAK